MAQVHIVEGIEEIGPELQIGRFGEVKILDESDIGAEVSWPIHRSLRRTISKRTWRRIREARRTHPLITPEIRGFLAALEYLIIAAAVRTGSTRAGSCGITAAKDGERKAGMRGHDRGRLPATDHLIDDGVHVRAETLASADR